MQDIVRSNSKTEICWHPYNHAANQIFVELPFTHYKSQVKKIRRNLTIVTFLLKSQKMVITNRKLKVSNAITRIENKIKPRKRSSTIIPLLR